MFIRYASPVLMLLVAVSLAAGQVVEKPVAEKRPVPDQPAQADAQRLVNEVYGDELAAAKTNEAKQALAKKLLTKANDPGNDSTARFVLLELSADTAVHAGNAEIAFEAIDALEKFLKVNSLEMKKEALNSLAANARTLDQRKSVILKATEVFEQAIAKDNFAVADQLKELLIRETPKAWEQLLAKEASSREAYKAASTAEITLAETPLDPDANLTVGKYRVLRERRLGRRASTVGVGERSCAEDAGRR